MDHFSDRVIEDVKRLLIVITHKFVVNPLDKQDFIQAVVVHKEKVTSLSVSSLSQVNGSLSSCVLLSAPSLPNGKSSCYSVSFYSLIPSILLQQNQPVDTVCCCRECTTLDHVVPIHTKEENWQDSIPKSSI
ncbi:hypothetical protein Pst134EB_030752 [Puccinia striiformis f. sp. tritici]|nr:hypothetical protein Pst134EB_030752 [Puccinia striiformis f. sp. tritici]